ERYGCAHERLVPAGETLQLPSTVAQGDRHVPRELLAHIIHQRTEEVFEMVRTHIEEAGFQGRLSAGVVLTGGAAAMPGTAELAIDVFGIGARVGSPSENIGGLTDSVDAPRFATAVGLAQYAAGRLALGHASSGGKRLGEPRSRVSMNVPVDVLAQRMKVWLQDF